MKEKQMMSIATHNINIQFKHVLVNHSDVSSRICLETTHRVYVCNHQHVKKRSKSSNVYRNQNPLAFKVLLQKLKYQLYNVYIISLYKSII